MRKSSRVSAPMGLFAQAGRLKSEPRRGWVKKLGVPDPESVADHSYRTALMAMVLSDLWGLDTGRAVRMALLHDLPEAVVGDAMPEERSGEAKAALETGAMKDLLRGLPPRLRARYGALWSDFVSGRSEEARLVRQLDKLEMAIQASEYVAEGYDRGTAAEFLASARREVKEARLVALLREVSG
jgi:putative hydrolases of HD superfamily